jgi:O-antigen ligase
MTNISINLIYIAICSLPYFLITGSFIPDFLVSFVAILFLFISVKERIWIYYKNNFFKLFILFYVIINLSAIFSEIPFILLETSIPYIRFVLFSLAIIFIINNKKNFEVFFLKNLIIVILALLLDGALQFFSGQSLIGWVKELFNIHIFDNNYSIKMNYKIQSLFGDKGVYGSYLLRFSPLLIFLIMKTNLFKKFNTLFIVFFYCSIFIAILFSGERSSLILFLILIFFNAIFLKSNKIFRLSIVLLAFLFLIFFLVFNKELNNRYINTTKYLIYNLNEQKNLNEIKKLEEENLDHKNYNSVTNYTGLFRTGLLMFADSPFLGKGPRAFKYLSGDERFSPQDVNGKKTIYYNSHPHNFYIQLLAEVGLFGFLYFLTFLFIFFYISFFYLGRKSFLNKDYEVIIFSSFLIVLWPFITTGNFFNNWLSIFHFFLIGFFLSNLYKNNSFKIK